jgi:hypothetical protein
MSPPDADAVGLMESRPRKWAKYRIDDPSILPTGVRTTILTEILESQGEGLLPDPLT